jgi:predicted phosphatase
MNFFLVTETLMGFFSLGSQFKQTDRCDCRCNRDLTIDRTDASGCDDRKSPIDHFFARFDSNLLFEARARASTVYSTSRTRRRTLRKRGESVETASWNGERATPATPAVRGTDMNE